MQENMQSTQSQPPYTPSQNHDEAGLLDVLLSKWKLVILFAILGTMVGFVAARYARDEFQSTAMLQLDTKNKSSKAMADIGELFQSQSPAMTEINLITSLRVLMPVVERLNLQYWAEPISKMDRLLRKEGRMDLEYFHVPEAMASMEYKWIVRVVDLESYELESPFGGVLAAGKVGETLRAKVGADTVAVCVKAIYAEPGQRFALSEGSVLGVAEGLRKDIGVAETAKNSNIIILNYKDRYPDRTAAILNAVAQAYVRQNVEMHSAEAEKTLEFLEEQLPAIKSKLDSSEQLLTNYRNTAGTVDLSMEAKGALERQVELKTSLLELEQMRQEKARLYKAEHPVMQTIIQQQEALRKEINQEHARTKKLPVTQQEVLKLQQDVEINNQMYTSLLNNIQQLRVVRAGEIGNVRIVDPAYVHSKPVGPNRKKIMAMGLGGGIGFCIVLLYLMRMFGARGVVSSSEIERETGVSVYAKVPKTPIDPKLKGTRNKRFVLAKADPEDLSIEKLRSLRTSLEFSFVDEGGKVLMVTGIIPGAGKSFVSLNLSYLLAQTGKRVLLIDCDLRKSRLSHKGEKGVSDVVKKEVALESALVDLGEGSFYLPIGTRISNPGELLASRGFAELMEEARQKFDLVILDTPPIALVADAQVLAKLSDFGIMVLEYKRHSMEQIKESLAQLETARLTKKAIVLNKCYSEGLGYGYGYGYGYGNKYRYSDKK